MRHGVKVIAWRRIETGDEITFDYRLNALDGDSWPCECGSTSCTGTVVGDFFALIPTRQELFLCPTKATLEIVRKVEDAPRHAETVTIEMAGHG